MHQARDTCQERTAGMDGTCVKVVIYIDASGCEVECSVSKWRSFYFVEKILSCYFQVSCSIHLVVSMVVRTVRSLLINGGGLSHHAWFNYSTSISLVVIEAIWWSTRC